MAGCTSISLAISQNIQFRGFACHREKIEPFWKSAAIGDDGALPPRKWDIARLASIPPSKAFAPHTGSPNSWGSRLPTSSPTDATCPFATTLSIKCSRTACCNISRRKIRTPRSMRFGELYLWKEMPSSNCRMYLGYGAFTIRFAEVSENHGILKCGIGGRVRSYQHLPQGLGKPN